MGLDPGVFGRFNLAALVQPHLVFVFVCLFDWAQTTWANLGPDWGRHQASFCMHAASSILIDRWITTKHASECHEVRCD